MTDRFIFHELARFDHQAVLTNNAISNAFGEVEAKNVCRIFAEWLHLEDDIEGINISFRGLASSPNNPNFVAAFSSSESKKLGGLSVATFFANHIVNLATKKETYEASDFDRGFLGILFADIADTLFAPIFSGMQLYLDKSTLAEAALTQEDYVFVFDLRIKDRSDHIFLHLPASWQPQIRPAANATVLPNIGLRFPIIAGTIPTTMETIHQCAPGDLLIPDHAIQMDGIAATHPYAQLKLSERSQINVTLSSHDEKWVCTFLDKDLSMDDSITNLLVDNAQINIRILAGSVEIPLKEISAIQPGFTLELDRAVHEGVELEVNGNVFAKGELVNVGGKLGVRIVSRA